MVTALPISYFRLVRKKLYDLDGKDYNEEDVMAIYIEALDEFKRENPSFIGSKFIYAPIKSVPNKTATTYFDIVRRLHTKFPQFLAGFDLVGQEDTAPGLVSFAEHILQLPDDIRFFFHAGETNWFGSVDENLVIVISFQFALVFYFVFIWFFDAILSLFNELVIQISFLFVHSFQYCSFFSFFGFVCSFRLQF